MGVNGESFITYLIQNGINYQYNNIEEFLLSIKLNKCVLLNGSSNTDKIIFLKSYINFLERNKKQRKLPLNFTIGKTAKNHGFAIPRKEIYSILPKLSYENGCKLIVDTHVVNARFNILPRIFIRPNDNEEFYNYINLAMDKGIEKLDYEIILNDFVNFNYKIFNASAVNITMPIIQDFLKEVIENISYDYFIIFNNVSKNNIQKIIFDDDEIPENLTIFYNGNIEDCIDLADNMAIIQFDPISPMDYLQNNLSNIKFKNIEYLENPEKEYLGNVNDIKKIVQDIYVSENKSLYNILLDELNKLYHILSTDDIYISTNCVDNILKYMIVSWKYEDCPDIFSNWYKYFDFQIIQRVIPLLSDNISIETFEALVDYCNGEYNYYRSYSKINDML